MHEDRKQKLRILIEWLDQELIKRQIIPWLKSHPESSEEFWLVYDLFDVECFHFMSGLQTADMLKKLTLMVLQKVI